MNPVLSVIIPCFNSEATLEETLQSIADQQFTKWEALIINDGSTDNTELIAKKWVEFDSRFKFYSKANGGLGSARNYGILNSIGQYILPLDSDNMVDPLFSRAAVEVLDSDKNIGVVHGHAEYIGEKTGIWKIQNFNFERLLTLNYIDACAIFRKSLWEEVGGYDENIPYQGIEDWELWIAFGSRAVKFHHLNTITFKYRVSSNSMIRSYSNEIYNANIDYLVRKYPQAYYYSYFNQFFQLQNLQISLKRSFYFKWKRRIKKVWTKMQNNKGSQK